MGGLATAVALETSPPSLLHSTPPLVRSPYSSFMTEDNAERLANALCRMRGAALKLGQMLSIQDENVLPPQVGTQLRCSAQQHCHGC